MTQPSIPGTDIGIPQMGFGSDGSNHYEISVDSDGHIHIDIVSSALPAGAATEATLLALSVICAALLETDDLSIDEITKHLRVDVEESALPSGAATEATLLAIKGYVDGLETLLAGGLPAALDAGALKIKEQAPLTGFATSAKQDTMITALQLIDDLRNALASVATDRVVVEAKGGDKLISFESIVTERVQNLDASAGTNFLNTTAVPSGKIHVYTNIHAVNVVSSITGILISLDSGSTPRLLKSIASPAALAGADAKGWFFVPAGWYARAQFVGCVLGDDIFLDVTGFQMDAP